MGVHDMRCPKCGKQSTEYDENKWQCLYCGNRFVYKEESPTYQSQTNVHLETNSLFDLEPYDWGNERLIEDRYLNLHSRGDDKIWAELDIRQQGRSLLIVLPGALSLWSFIIAAIVLNDGGYSRSMEGVVLLIVGLLCAVISVFFVMKRNNVARERDERADYLETLKEPVGWITLCPACKEEHSRYRFSDKDLASGPVHCQAYSCGKQFMLLNGKARVIKR